MDQEKIRNVNRLIREGEHELVAREYERALNHFRKAYEMDSKNVTAIVNMGFCYAKLEKFQHAQKCFTTALDINPHNIVARRNLGRILRPQGLPYPDPFKKSVPDKETVFTRYIELAQESEKRGNLFSTIQYLEAASKIHPEFIDPYLRIASCYEELGETEKACTAFKQALSIYSGDETAQKGVKRCCDGISTDDDTSKSADENIVIIYEEDSDSLEEIEVVEISTSDDDTSRSADENIIIIDEEDSDSLEEGMETSTDDEEDAQEEIVEISDETEEKTPASPPSPENDPISAILSQFENEDETDKKEEPVSQPASPSTQFGDDPIASILEQFKDDVEPENQSVSEQVEMKPDVGTDIPALATSDDGKVSGKHAILDILDQYKDDIVDDTNEVVNSAESLKTVSTAVDDDMIKNLLSQQAESSVASSSAYITSDIPHTGSAPEIGKAKEKREAQDSDRAIANLITLAEEQKDALQELGNIGASHAATTLSTMLQTTILMNVPEIRILGVGGVSDYIGDEDSAFAIFTMEGEIQQAGYVILQVIKESVIQISTIMLGMPNEPREMNEMDESAITEIGNIMVSAFLDATAELLSIIMLPSPPRTIMGRASAVIPDIVDSGDLNCDSIVLFKTEMICNDYALQCNILMMPSQSVLYNILEMLENLIKDK